VIVFNLITPKIFILENKHPTLPLEKLTERKARAAKETLPSGVAGY